MTSELRDAYPPDAYAPDGTLWWRLEVWPGTRRRFGEAAFFIQLSRTSLARRQNLHAMARGIPRTS